MRRVSRRLQKKRRDGELTPTLELPERFRNHGDPNDGEEEVLRPQGYGGGLFMNMNQSIFGLIAAAGSQADFADQFEGNSSDDEDEGERRMAKTIAGPKALRAEGSSLARTTVLPKRDSAHNKAHGRHRKKLSESRLLRSVPGLARFTEKLKSSKSTKDKPDLSAQEGHAMPSTSQPESDRTPSIDITRTAIRTPAARTSREPDSRTSSDEPPRSDEDETTGPTELAKKLKEIFEFDKEEEVIEEYPCWLLQHVLLEGHMYITARHIAFYAYLPKKAVSARSASCPDALWSV